MEYLKLCDVSFFQNHSPILKHIYFLYSLAGGVYYENYMGKLKYFLVFSAILANVFFMGSCIKILMQDKLEYISTSYVCNIIAFLLTTIFNPMTTYIKREKLRKLFNLLGENADEIDAAEDENQDENEEDIKKISIAKNLLTYYKLLSYWFSTLLPGRLISKYVTSKTPFQVDVVRDFLIPFPFDCSQSYVSYAVIIVIQFTLSWQLTSNYNAPIFLLFIILYCFKNQTIDLRNTMKFQSNFIMRNVQQSYDQETEIIGSASRNKRRELDAVSKSRERCIKEFALEMKEWIRRHQRLHLIISHAQEYLELILSFHLALILVAFITTAYHLVQVSTGKIDLRWEIIFFNISYMLLLWMYCMIGTGIEEMGDSLSEELYSTPWYLLPPEHRKMLYTFLCLTQKTRKIHAFKIFPVSLPLLPTMLNNVYSYVQNIRTIEMKIKK